MAKKGKWRQPSTDVEEVLSEHRNWLHSGEGRQADFTNQDLQQTSFAGRDLRQAIFRGANLQVANFQEACLQEADFRGANLRKAEFGGADLQEAELSQANLQNVDLTAVRNLSWSNLAGADLTGKVVLKSQTFFPV